MLEAGSSSGMVGNRYQSLIDFWVVTWGLVKFGGVAMLTGSSMTRPDGGERNIGLAGKACPPWVGLPMWPSQLLNHQTIISSLARPSWVKKKMLLFKAEAENVRTVH